MSEKSTVCHLTSAHSDGDIRIFRKLAISSAEKYKTYCIVPNAKSRLEENVHVIGFRSTPRSRLMRMIRTVNIVLDEAIKVQADIYHLHDPELLRIVKKLKHQTGAKIIFDSHEDVPKQILDKYWIPKPFRKIISKIYAINERRSCKHVDGIVSVTPIICKRFSKYHENVEMIANFPSFANIEMDNVVRKTNHICYVGGLYQSRGIKEIVEAIDECDVVLHLAGSFDSKEFELNLKSLPAWNKVIFHGQVEQSKVRTILAECSIGIVTLHPTPSYLEAYPIKMFEYMNAGLAILSSDFPLYRELIGNIACCQFVDPLNPREIASVLNEMLKNPTHLTEMGKRAKNAAEKKFNWNSEKEKLHKFYHKLLNE